MLNFFIERPVFSTVIALIMILVGALAAVSLPSAGSRRWFRRKSQ